MTYADFCWKWIESLQFGVEHEQRILWSEPAVVVHDPTKTESDPKIVGWSSTLFLRFLVQIRWSESHHFGRSQFIEMVATATCPPLFLVPRMPCRRISQRPWQPATNRDLGTRQAAIHSEGPKPKGWWYTTVSSGTYTFIYIWFSTYDQKIIKAFNNLELSHELWKSIVVCSIVNRLRVVFSLSLWTITLDDTICMNCSGSSAKWSKVNHWSCFHYPVDTLLIYIYVYIDSSGKCDSSWYDMWSIV